MVSFRSAMNSAEKAMQHQRHHPHLRQPQATPDSRQHPRLRWLQVTLLVE
jgi:hypothetical protein